MCSFLECKGQNHSGWSVLWGSSGLYCPTQNSVVRASDKLVDDDQLAELIAAHQAVTIFFSGVTATTVSLYHKTDEMFHRCYGKITNFQAYFSSNNMSGDVLM